MNDYNNETIIGALVEQINTLKIQIRIKDIEIENLKKDNAKLNEYLNPTKKVGEKDE